MSEPTDTPIPAPKDDDDEDVHWALSTAGALWSRGERTESLRWLRRAAERASDANAELRALELMKAAADVAGLVQAAATTAKPNGTTSTAPRSTKPAQQTTSTPPPPSRSLPPPPPSGAHSVAERTSKPPPPPPRHNRESPRPATPAPAPTSARGAGKSPPAPRQGRSGQGSRRSYHRLPPSSQRGPRHGDRDNEPVALLPRDRKAAFDVDDESTSVIPARSEPQSRAPAPEASRPRGKAPATDIEVTAEELPRNDNPWGDSTDAMTGGYVELAAADLRAFRVAVNPGDRPGEVRVNVLPGNGPAPAGSTAAIIVATTPADADLLARLLAHSTRR